MMFGSRILDIDGITDGGIRAQYAHQVRRFASIGAAVEKAYGLNNLKIRTLLLRDDQFNASVRRNRSRYEIFITSSVPLLLMIFFDRIVASPGVMRWLEAPDTGTVNYDIPFSMNPSYLWERQDWTIQTTPLRSFAAHTLSDMATSFMFLHEIGHIVGGHLESLGAQGHPASIGEFNHNGLAPPSDRALLQCWEYEADAIAAGLIVHYIEELVETTRVDQRTREVFGPAEAALEQCVSLCIAALYALFAYLRGLSLEVDSSQPHPDPLVRAFYTRDLIWRAVAARYPLREELCLDLMEARFEEFSSALASAGLQSEGAFSDEHFGRIDAGVEAIKTLHKKHRHITSAFSWVAWE